MLLVLSLVLLLTGCAQGSPVSLPQKVKEESSQASTAAGAPVELTVLSAASLTEPFTEIGQLYESTHPGVSVYFSFAGSQQLAQQIIEGAPVDVFASASQKLMDTVIANNMVNSTDQAIFSRNSLVVILPLRNPAAIQSLQDLAHPGIKIDLAAAEVPVGKYSLDFLNKTKMTPEFGTGYTDRVLGNVVSYEGNVKAVLTKVLLGEVDAGIVYTSDVTGHKDELLLIEIPDRLNVIASYPIAKTTASSHPDQAQAFIDLVLSPQGQAVLARYGFLAAE